MSGILPEDDGEKGCGVYFVKTSENDPFFESCEEHDRGYEQKVLPRKIVDSRFYKGVKKKVSQCVGVVQCAHWSARGGVYIAAVAALGWLFW